MICVFDNPVYAVKRCIFANPNEFIGEIGDGGHYRKAHGGMVRLPGEKIIRRFEDQQLAILAILAIQEYYG